LRKPDAAVRIGLADPVLVVRAVEVDVALERIAPRALVHAGLEPRERQDARQDQVRLARLAAPHVARWATGSRTRRQRLALADPRVDAVPAGRRAVRAFLAADAEVRRRHGQLERHARRSRSAPCRCAATSTTRRRGGIASAPARRGGAVRRARARASAAKSRASRSHARPTLARSARRHRRAGGRRGRKRRGAGSIRADPGGAREQADDYGNSTTLRDTLSPS
jgi:hypothetical protein